MEPERTFFEYLQSFSEAKSPIDFVLIYDNLGRFFDGALVTLQLTFLALLVGGLIAVPLAIARAYRKLFFSPVIRVYTYVFCGTPLLVQVYLFYFGLGQFKAVQESFLWDPILSSPWWCVVIAFTLNTAAYTTEFMRGAIETTPHGEVEAAKASGMSALTRMRLVILPNAFRRSLPAYSNEVIFTLHGSVIASTVTLQDLLGVGRWLNGRYYLAYEGFLTAMIFYMAIVLLITVALRLAEKRLLGHLRPRETSSSAAARVAA
ncbi:ABC transporter permease [Puniceibacterium sediminis]|uniref:Arginine/ornithine transport system permease protein n=1 Tax=Puniceibacterium sediminis TaxID=1608407 RepID=A0A238ZM13_9RHOB|nr:ABC transporter permease [Puniceibacterium sediminis]SNR84407.1 arginine/ornithine transport system permease protein [Puniceibacterium sediminis]